MSDENLWPEDIFKNKVEMPKAIFIEQANNLAIMSNNVILGEVHTRMEEDIFGEKILVHDFVMRAPSIDNYEYTLFTARHELIHPYPVSIPFSGIHHNITDADRLKKLLSEIFKHEKTRQIVTSIISQI